MASGLSYVEYVSTGGSNYVVPFPYKEQSDVSVYLNGMATNDYYWEDATNIRTNSPIPSGTIVLILRDSDIVNRDVDFDDGTRVTENDLEEDSVQQQYLIQEVRDHSDRRDAEIEEQLDLLETVIGESTPTNFDEDFTVIGVEQGSYTDGSVIMTGTALLDVVKNMLTKVIGPTYTAPTLSLSGSGTKIVETGTNVTPELTPTFNQNDGGPANNYDLNKDSVLIFNNDTPIAHTDVAFNVPDGSTVYQASVSYDDGPVKNDNTGNPDPTGQILAGTVTSNNVSYIGRRNTFYQIDGDIVNIRSNSGTYLGASDGTLISFSGSGSNFVIAYPDTLRDVNTVILTSSGFAFDITSELVRESDQSVNDANGANPITYKVFSYTPDAPFTDADIDITI